MYKNISFVIPTLNESDSLNLQRTNLAALIHEGYEIIVIDGGSQDDTISIAQHIGCKCIETKASRGYQLHVGAKACSHEIIIFLHADTGLTVRAVKNAQQALQANNKHWGRFNVSFTNEDLVFKVIAWFMNLRSCLTAIVTGDQALFMLKEVYFSTGGFSDIPLMEDIEFSKRLKRHSRPVCLNDSVVTSSRKWERNGILNTILSMWRFRIMYYFGTSPDKLARLYYK